MTTELPTAALRSFVKRCTFAARNLEGMGVGVVPVSGVLNLLDALDLAIVRAREEAIEECAKWASDWGVRQRHGNYQTAGTAISMGLRALTAPAHPRRGNETI